ncbi:hypothetical protein DV515_00005766 [Chloebia gouldiae]|uniref:Uncharacterized protein n=1 Tax=Chloebia gouldiae TaxID=44316 RepID=A0A3L8SNE7_CHLGU|nr:hypothetical protein DV515_00005766 [Chloebia gouldiae]
MRGRAGGRERPGSQQRSAQTSRDKPSPEPGIWYPVLQEFRRLLPARSTDASFLSRLHLRSDSTHKGYSRSIHSQGFQFVLIQRGKEGHCGIACKTFYQQLTSTDLWWRGEGAEARNLCPVQVESAKAKFRPYHAIVCPAPVNTGNLSLQGPLMPEIMCRLTKKIYYDEIFFSHCCNCTAPGDIKDASDRNASNILKAYYTRDSDAELPSRAKKKRMKQETQKLEVTFAEDMKRAALSQTPKVQRCFGAIQELEKRIKITVLISFHTIVTTRVSSLLPLQVYPLCHKERQSPATFVWNVDAHVAKSCGYFGAWIGTCIRPSVFYYPSLILQQKRSEDCTNNRAEQVHSSIKPTLKGPPTLSTHQTP